MTSNELPLRVSTPEGEPPPVISDLIGYYLKGPIA